VERRIAVALHYPIDQVLVVSLQRGRAVGGLYQALAAFLEAQNNETAAMIRKGERRFGEYRFVVVVAFQVQPVLDLQIEVFARVDEQIGKPFGGYSWRRSVRQGLSPVFQGSVSGMRVPGSSRGLAFSIAQVPFRYQGVPCGTC